MRFLGVRDPEEATHTLDNAPWPYRLLEGNSMSLSTDHMKLRRKRKCGKERESIADDRWGVDLINTA